MRLTEIGQICVAGILLCYETSGTSKGVARMIKTVYTHQWETALMSSDSVYLYPITKWGLLFFKIETTSKEKNLLTEKANSSFN